MHQHLFTRTAKDTIDQIAQEGAGHVRERTNWLVDERSLLVGCDKKPLVDQDANEICNRNISPIDAGTCVQPVVAVLADRFSFSAGAYAYDSRGWRPNNDLNQTIYNVFGQAEVAPGVNFQIEYRERESDEGDLAFNFEPSDFVANKSVERKLESARALLDQLPREQAQAMAERLDALEADLSGASLTERRQKFLDSLAKGSYVYLPRYRQRVIVHKVDKAKRIVTAKLGSMKVQVSFDEVTWYESL